MYSVAQLSRDFKGKLPEISNSGHENEAVLKGEVLFTDYAAKEQQVQADEAAHAKERKIQEAMLDIKKKYGKNAILKGMNLEDGATARERNQTIGGHQA